MTRIVLAFMLALTLQTVSADVLLINEVQQSERMQLPKNGYSKADIEAKKLLEKCAFSQFLFCL